MVIDLQCSGLLPFPCAGMRRFYLFGHAYLDEVDTLHQILLFALGLHVALEVVVLLLQTLVHLALLLQHLPQLLDLLHHLLVVLPFLLLGLKRSLLLELDAEPFVSVSFIRD